MITVTDMYFINQFKATEKEVNELGEKFGAGVVYRALADYDSTFDIFIKTDLTPFERARVDIFLGKVQEILEDHDIDIYDRNIRVHAEYNKVFAKGGLGNLPQYDEIYNIAEKAGIELV